MAELKLSEFEQDLGSLCSIVRSLSEKGEYGQAERLVKVAMSNFPHAPEPHNLMGVLLEHKGDNITALKHFRAAWALNPTYLPARYNLDRFGSFFSTGSCAYDITDCPEPEEKGWK